MRRISSEELFSWLGAGFPLEGVLVDLEASFTDDRGDIFNLLVGTCGSVSRITSNAGAIRANHYHKTDWHLAYVERGELHYYERTLGSQGDVTPTLITQGQLFFTPPQVEHAMEFLEPTVLYTFSRNNRDHESHESDVVRVNFVTK